ncbi:MAG: hypothetical protein ACLR5G_07525 [Eubacteriales bacterium]
MTGPDGCVHDVPRPAPRVSASEKPAGIPVGCGGTQAEPKIYHTSRIITGWTTGSS